MDGMLVLVSIDVHFDLQQRTAFRPMHVHVKEALVDTRISLRTAALETQL